MSSQEINNELILIEVKNALIELHEMYLKKAITTEDPAENERYQIAAQRPIELVEILGRCLIVINPIFMPKVKLSQEKENSRIVYEINSRIEEIKQLFRDLNSEDAYSIKIESVRFDVAPHNDLVVTSSFTREINVK